MKWLILDLSVSETSEQIGSAPWTVQWKLLRSNSHLTLFAAVLGGRYALTYISVMPCARIKYWQQRRSRCSAVSSDNYAQEAFSKAETKQTAQNNRQHSVAFSLLGHFVVALSVCGCRVSATVAVMLLTHFDCRSVAFSLLSHFIAAFSHLSRSVADLAV